MMPHDVICMSEFVLFNNAIILQFYLVKQRNCCSALWYGRRNKRRCNSSYKFCAETKCGVRWLWTEFCNNHWYLASIPRLLKHVDNDEIWNRQCGIIRLRSGTSACHHRAGRTLRTTCHNSHKSAREIRTYKPTSWGIHLLTCSKPYATFQTSFRALLSNIWLWINNTLVGVLTFLGHSIGRVRHGTVWSFRSIEIKSSAILTLPLTLILTGNHPQP